MKKTVFIFLFHAVLCSAQSHWSYSELNDSTIKERYIFGSGTYSYSELMLQGYTENPAVKQSRELVDFSKSSGDILVEQMKAQNAIAMNAPRKPTPEEISKANYYESLAREKQATENEIYSEIKETHTYNTSEPASPSYKLPHLLRLADTTPTVKAATILYGKAYDELCHMLNGQDTLDLKRAVFIVENAYYGNTLNYPHYLHQIDSLVSICQSFLKQHKLSSNNKLACNYAIQSLYSDTLKTGRNIFYPLSYDYKDFMGDNDYSKQFVTKLLNTGTGQCHSMPLLYLILAQELHTEAYLVLAPAHSYIKYPIGNTLYGYECTCGRQTNDKFITASGYISSEAIYNKIYLAPQTPLQTIAQCLLDLSTQYAITYGYNDWVYYCCQTVLHFNPLCIGALQSIANAGAAFCANCAARYNYPAQADYDKYPDLKQKFDNMVALQMQIDKTGYIQIPKEQYAKWLESANSEEQKKIEAQLKNKLHSYLETQTQ